MPNSQLNSLKLYLSIRNHYPYSAQWFKTLTFDSAAELSMPVILERGSARVVRFSPEEPTGQAGTTITANEDIPSYYDIKIDQQHLLEEFTQGSRSVVVELIFGTDTEERVYHFAKVSLNS